MTNPISSNYASHANPALQPETTKAQPKPETSKSTAIGQDTVTLKGNVDVDHDGDSH